MSLIADSLKKAIKEKSFNVGPGINLLKHLGSQNKPKFDPKEIKRFVILIVIPATILAYLLLANPFDPKKRTRPAPPPVVAKIPPAVKPVAPPTPKPKKPQPVQKTAPIKVPDDTPILEPGMREVSVPEDQDEITKPKQVPGPKKEVSADKTQAPTLTKPPIAVPPPQIPDQTPAQSEAPEKAVSETPVKKKVIRAQPEKKFAPSQHVKNPDFSGKPPEAPDNGLSFPSTAEPEVFKNSDFYFNQAIFYQQSQNWEKALTNYSKAAELDADNADIYNNIGVIYKELRQYDRAIEEFLRAAYLKPNYAKPYNNIGVVYYAQKDFAGAIRNYQKAISIDPKNLEALNNLAVVYKRIDQLERAKTVLNQAIKINPAHSGTHYNLAVIYEKEGNLKSAIHFYRRFVELGAASHPALSLRVKKHIESLK